MAQSLDPLALQRFVVAPGPARSPDILALQRAAGNRAVSHLIQTKLTVGPAGDRYEQEADRVAEQVLTMPLPSPSRRGAGGEVQRQDEDEEIQAKPLAATICPLLQRQEEEEELQASPLVQPFDGLRVRRQEEEEEEDLQASPLVQPFDGLRVRRQEEEEEVQIKPRTDRGFQASADVEQRLTSQKGGGSPLPEERRAFMEPRIGADFSGVRVHGGGEAVQLTRELKAQAFTHGQDVYCGAGKCDPGSSRGRRLLAHELTHVVQQGGVGSNETRTKPESRRPRVSGLPNSQPVTANRTAKTAIQRELIPDAEQAFETAEEENPDYSDGRRWTDDYMPTAYQRQVIKITGRLQNLKAKLSGLLGGARGAKAILKDFVRAFLLKEYASRLRDESVEDNEHEKKRRAKRYLPKALETRDKYAGLLKKRITAPETQAFLEQEGFEDGIEVTEEQVRKERAQGPRIDVRSTYWRATSRKILGIQERPHLFIVYTDSDGRQWYFRGAPEAHLYGVMSAYNSRVAVEVSEYLPGTVDWDPSAPSKTVLKGDKAADKLDALRQAAAAVDAMKVPYVEKQWRKLKLGGENCNTAVYTILDEAGIPKNKPSGIFIGWGHRLGEFIQYESEESTSEGEGELNEGEQALQLLKRLKQEQPEATFRSLYEANQVTREQVMALQHYEFKKFGEFTALFGKDDIRDTMFEYELWADE